MSRPSTVRLNLAFRVRGLGLPGTVSVDLEFGVSGPEPTIYVFDRGDWQPAAQRVWTGSEWFPPTI